MSFNFDPAKVCACGKTHTTAVEHVTIEEGAINAIPGYAKAYGAKKAFLIGAICAILTILAVLTILTILAIDTDRLNLVASVIKQPLTIQSPVVDAVAILTNANYWRVSILTISAVDTICAVCTILAILAVVDCYCTTL